jgi:class 3 adenylate cyclase
MFQSSPLSVLAFADPRISKVRTRRSLLCSDIVGFTSLLSRLGDAAALQIVRRHDAIVRRCAAEYGGEILELRGDGFLVSFVRRHDAVACAVDIQRALAADRNDHPDGGVRVRIGVHTGEFFAERSRLFGLEMVVPFRLLEHAGAGEILASGGSPDDPATPIGSAARNLPLKGIPAPVRAVTIEWRYAEGGRPTPPPLADVAVAAA